MTILRPYIYRHTPYRPPPLYQGLRSRVLQGHRDPGSRVTMGYRVTGSRVLLGHRVTGLSGLLPAFSPSPVSPGSSGLGSRVTRVTGSRVTMSHHHPGYRVTHHPGLGSRVTPQPYLQGHHGLGSHTTMVLPLGAYRHRKPANREPPILYRIFRKRVQSYLI